MRLTILGMNGPFPAPGGATSGYFLSAGETEIALDLGSGTLSRLTALTPPEKLSALLLTHWHYDHCSDLLPLIFRLAACAEEPLNIYAPVDENCLVRRAMQQSGVAVLHNVHPGDAFTVGDVQVQTFAARHPVPAVMYRLTQGDKTLCYTGDTNTVEGLTDFARGADLLLADGLFTEDTWAEGKPHLSASLAAKAAREAGVGRLVITHLNPCIDPDTLLREARVHRSDAVLAACGDAYEL